MNFSNSLPVSLEKTKTLIFLTNQILKDKNLRIKNKNK
jgi:hypothetical protein